MPCAKANDPVGHRRAPAGVLQRVIWGASCPEPEEAADLAIERRPDRTERRRSRQCPKMPQINWPVLHHPMDPGCDPQDGADCPRLHSRTDSFYLSFFWCIFVLKWLRDEESIPRVGYPMQSIKFEPRDVKRKRRSLSISARSLPRSCRSNIWMFRQELAYVGEARSFCSSNRTLLQENQRKMCRACSNNKTFVERAYRLV